MPQNTLIIFGIHQYRFSKREVSCTVLRAFCHSTVHHVSSPKIADLQGHNASRSDLVDLLFLMIVPPRIGMPGFKWLNAKVKTVSYWK